MGLEDDITELTPELLNDFYAECDEHLNVMRQSLVTLERGVEHEEATALIERLYRSAHSLKGIVAMAGIQSAEQLTHRIEDYLRELTKGKNFLTSKGLDLLANSVQLLEQSVDAFRQKQPYPEVERILEQFGELLITSLPKEAKEKTSKPPLADALGSRVEDAQENGLHVWKASFTPTLVLNERGVDVNAIRSRLAGIGEIIHAAPNAPPFVDGVVFSRGQVIPAVNLRVRFGFSPQAPTLRTRLLVVQAGERAVGLTVDSAREFRPISAQVIQLPDSAISGFSGKFLTGIANLEDRLVLILDLRATLELIETPTAELAMAT